MSLDLVNDERPVTSVDELVAWFKGAERPRDRHRIGLEHEKFIYPRSGIHAVPYDGERVSARFFMRWRRGATCPTAKRRTCR